MAAMCVLAIYILIINGPTFLGLDFFICSFLNFVSMIEHGDTFHYCNLFSCLAVSVVNLLYATFRNIATCT